MGPLPAPDVRVQASTDANCCPALAICWTNPTANDAPMPPAGVVGLILIVVVEKTLKLADLPALGMALSNTFGLSAGILLMGYGLVEIPREMWKSDHSHLLKWCAHRCVVSSIFECWSLLGCYPVAAAGNLCCIHCLWCITEQSLPAVHQICGAGNVAGGVQLGYAMPTTQCT